jgi:hypothetical protein
MKRVLLYYPAINIPDGNWLRNSLLYTDSIASIFPFYSVDDERVSEETKMLYSEGFYEPIQLFGKLIDANPEFKKFEKLFIDTIESSGFKKLKKEYKKYKHDENSFTLYAEKLSHSLADYLTKKKLLTRENYGILSVEKNAAIVYMSMLATYLARTSTDSLLIPSTDQQEYEKLAFQLADNKELTYRFQLDKCLPSPSPDCSIKSILKFKKKREQELIKFRKEIDKLESELKSANDDEERKLKMIQFQEQIKLDLIEIKKLMGDSSLKYLLNGLSSLLEIKKPEIVGTLTGLGVAGAVATVLPFVGLGAGALLLTGTLVSSYRQIHREVAANSSSYIYYAGEAGIILT